jgi:hypothetical protein
MDREMITDLSLAMNGWQNIETFPFIRTRRLAHDLRDFSLGRAFMQPVFQGIHAVLITASPYFNTAISEITYPSTQTESERLLATTATIPDALDTPGYEIVAGNFKVFRIDRHVISLQG